MQVCLAIYSWVGLLKVQPNPLAFNKPNPTTKPAWEHTHSFLPQQTVSSLLKCMFEQISFISVKHTLSFTNPTRIPQNRKCNVQKRITCRKVTLYDTTFAGQKWKYKNKIQLINCIYKSFKSIFNISIRFCSCSCCSFIIILSMSPRPNGVHLYLVTLH